MFRFSKFLLASFFGLAFQKLISQNQFAILEKNHNEGAKDLVHELNASNDTLMLKCNKTIDYVYAINSEYKREIDFYNNTNNLSIPLKQLTKGKHVFVVSHSKKQIVFVVRVLSDHRTLALTTQNEVTSISN